MRDLLHGATEAGAAAAGGAQDQRTGHPGEQGSGEDANLRGLGEPVVSVGAFGDEEGHREADAPSAATPHTWRIPTPSGRAPNRRRSASKAAPAMPKILPPTSPIAIAQASELQAAAAS